MIIKNVRIGYDGGGVACGPVEGSCLVEATAVNDDGKVRFILASVFENFEKVYVSEMPLFDLAVNLTSCDVDFDYELNMMESKLLEEYDFEIGNDEPEEMNDKSEYFKVIRIVRAAMKAYLETEDTDGKDLAQKVMDEYADKELSEINVPYVCEFDEEEEEDE